MFSVLSMGAADLTITFQTSAKAFLGSKTMTETHYYSSRYQLIQNKSTRSDSLVDFEKAVSYTIDHEHRMISMLRLEDALAALDAMEDKTGGGVSGMMGAVFGDPGKCEVKKTGTEVVAGRTCTLWDIKVGKLQMLLSADPSLVPPIPSGSYTKMIRARAALMAKAGPMATAFRKLYEEMSRIKGIPLRTKMSGFMGTSSSSVATEIKQGPIPASTFALPGYPVEDAGKRLREELAKQQKD
nr:hypothetical protein [uncultured Holophaga sp.]